MEIEEEGDDITIDVQELADRWLKEGVRNERKFTEDFLQGVTGLKRKAVAELISAGYDTPGKLLEASEHDILKVKRIRKKTGAALQERMEKLRRAHEIVRPVLRKRRKERNKWIAAGIVITLFLGGTAGLFIWYTRDSDGDGVRDVDDAYPHIAAFQDEEDLIRSFEWVEIESGTFFMGAEESQDIPAASPVHRVSITREFEMMRFEVTQAQWRAVMGEWDKSVMDHYPDYYDYFGEGDQHPVYFVSWDQCQEFARRMNEKDPEHRYRLPTEAEWEYSARAGSDTSFYWGEIADENYAWYEKNSGKQTHPVGEKLPNAWGLYDMAGNVGEWCNDRYNVTYYSSSPEKDPQGSESDDQRVWRGGNWHDFEMRTAVRRSAPPDDQNELLGLRLVRVEP